MCNKHVVDESALPEWKYKIITNANEKINILSTRNISVKYYKNVLQQKEQFNTLTNIHNDFVVTPIDKAKTGCIYLPTLCYCPSKRTRFRSKYD